MENKFITISKGIFKKLELDVRVMPLPMTEEEKARAKRFKQIIEYVCETYNNNAIYES